MNLLGLAWVIVLFSPGGVLHPLPTPKNSTDFAYHGSPQWFGWANNARPIDRFQSFSASLLAWSQRSPYTPATVRVVRQDPPRPNQRQKLPPHPTTFAAFWHCTHAVKPEKPHSPIPNRRVYQVWVGDHLVAALPHQSQANRLSDRLKALLQNPAFNPASLRVGLVGNDPVGLARNELLFRVDAVLEKIFQRSSDLIAIDWINNLRVATGVSPIPLVEAQSAMYGLIQSRRVLAGVASWYGPYFHNRLTATGERFNQHDLTAAHPSLPFNTFLKVTNLKTRHSVIVRINDRGPYVGRRSLDLSRQAARCVGSEERGVVPYEAVIMQPIDIAQVLPTLSKPEQKIVAANLSQQRQ